jgi:hypothetical protein
MSLVDLIAQADERGLAASGLACLDRCVPLLGGDDEVLRPLWASLSDADESADWGEGLRQAREKLGGSEGSGEGKGPGEGEGSGDGEASGEGEAALLARRMLSAAPDDRCADRVRVWADACSVAALQIHRLLDSVGDPDVSLDSRRAGRTEGMSPLVAAELRRQVTVLEVLAGHGAGGLRRALEVSIEGRRVLQAVVARRARRG